MYTLIRKQRVPSFYFRGNFGFCILRFSFIRVLVIKKNKNWVHALVVTLATLLRLINCHFIIIIIIIRVQRTNLVSSVVNG